MRSTILALSALVASAVGQNSTAYNMPADFNIGLVKTDDLNSWCLGQRNTCPEICNGDTKQNSCDPATLKYQCMCGDGSVPDVSSYVETVPFYVCQATYGQCIDSHPNDATGQRTCKKSAKCGSKNASATDTTASSSVHASSTLTMATSTGSSSSNSAKSGSVSSVAAASTTSNAAVMDGLQVYSTGLLAGAMFFAMRLVL
ncbi:hypothetical protein N7510_006001 [Penicillium lagena]|uniref:uncharacterized protein n=1 Tax=Penicillium lagena TaxID=94218 RepID=UPI002541AD14|nr:uncharacterized protein N7510_006001 [Penicillium lagena]KAJ5612807.1 hypothetical protein N7510_006001 [Penicillium lagena]